MIKQIAFLCLLAYAFGQDQGLQVNITQGIVQGAKATDGDYYTFYGIHYGRSTGGEYRFKPPRPAPTYPGVYVAHDSSIICAQPGPNGLIGTEDCLTLNIFTNSTIPAKPVLVWLDAQEYTNSDSVRRSFRKLVLEGIVVVQINFRISIFGFLCLGVPEASGNAGLKDVVQALKWIKENIASFGGDPNNVILFGHGSGAAMVDLITMSPSANGLVHKAIAQSGSALAPWAIAYEPIAYAHALGAELGYTDKTNEELAKLLAKTDIDILVNAIREFEFYNNTILFAPCIEDAKLNDTFLTEAPVTILRSGNYSHIPYIGGYVDREGTLRAEQAAFRKWLDKMQTNFSQFLPVDLDFGPNNTNVEKSIREYYWQQREINMETIEDFLDFEGDTLVLVSTIMGAKERASTSQADVRLYEFAYKGKSPWPLDTIPLSGASHGAILNYLLDYNIEPLDEPVMTSLVARYVAFFRTGSPTPVKPQGAVNVWPAISNISNLQYLIYTGRDHPETPVAIYTEEIRENPHVQRMNFWNDIYSKYYVAPRSVSSAGGIFGAVLLVVLSQVVARLF